MLGVLSRASGEDRRVRRHPAHAMPPPGRKKRNRINGPRNGSHHSRVVTQRVSETRHALAELRQRVARLAHARRIADVVVAFVDTHSSVRHHQGVRPVRARAIRVALFTCVISAGFITAAPSLTSADGSPERATSRPHRPPLEAASGSTALRPSASEQPPTGAGAAPKTATTPSVDGRREEQRSPSPRGGLSLDVQSTPPAPDDPDLDRALSDLDRQADLDQLMWQQRGLGEQSPPAPTAGPPAALPDGQVPVPPPLAASSSAGLPPQSGPSTTAKPSGARSGQPASSRWALFSVAEPHRESATREEI
jgi:hypothetical protein